jgi:DNA-binding XRE family transcriptional regulator
MYTGQRVSCFKDRFNELFAESNKTNTDLGKDLHVSNQTVSAWRLGARSPKEPTVIAIASFFKVSVQWLLGFDVKKEQTDDGNTERIPIVVPDSEKFVKLVRYMPQSDYIMVMEAFAKAEQRLLEAEGGIDG